MTDAIATGPGRVDAHAHVFGTVPEERRAVDELAPADRRADVEELWRTADQVGVSGLVLVPLGTDDATAAAALAAYPGRCAGVAVAGPDDLGDEGPAHLSRRRERYRFDAVRMMWIGEPGRPLETSPAWPLLRAMADRDLVLWAYLGPDQAPFLADLARALPDLRVVLNHLGFAPTGMLVDEHRRPRFPGALDGATVDRVLGLAEHPRMHLMVSGHYALSRTGWPYDDLASETRRLVGAYGAERCLWGSDFPWPSDQPGYAETLEAVTQMLTDLSAAELALVLGGTARRLFTTAFAEENV